MRTVHRSLLLGVLAAALGFASSAAALTVGHQPGSAGLDQGFGYTGCPTSCTPTYTLDATAPLFGGQITFANDLTLAAEVVTVNLVIASVSFSDGVDTVTFTDVNYLDFGLNATVTPLGGGLLLVQQTLDDSFGEVHGDFSATQGGSGPFLENPRVHSFQCIVDAQGQGSCGVTFGFVGFNLFVDGGGERVDFQHTFNLIVPEPATWMMMLVGLVGLGYLGRSRRGA